MPYRRAFRRRRAFLIVFGAAYLLIAKSLIDRDISPAARHAFRFALGLMPIGGWALVWLTCGFLALADATITRHGRDVIGYAAATIAPIAWSVVYLAAWLQGAAHEWEHALLYGLIAAAVLIVSGMPDPQTVRQALEALR